MTFLHVNYTAHTPSRLSLLCF